MAATQTVPGRMFRYALLLPVRVTWRFATVVCNAVGILMCLVLGALFVTLGYFLLSTIIGAIFGLPLFILGMFLLLRALY